MKGNLGKIFLLMIIIIIFSSIIVSAASVDDPYPELQRVKKFIFFIVDVIRWGASSVAGLIAAVVGWQVMHAGTQNGLDIAKKAFKNALWGLFFIFGGTSVASFFVKKFVSIFLG